MSQWLNVNVKKYLAIVSKYRYKKAPCQSLKVMGLGYIFFCLYELTLGLGGKIKIKRKRERERGRKRGKREGKLSSTLSVEEAKSFSSEPF